MDTRGMAYSLQGFNLYVRPQVTARKPGNGGRSEIRSFSSSSAGRMRRYLRCCRAEYSVMVTLTYRDYPRDGRIAKAHLRAFIERCRRFNQHNGKWSLFWFLEFQQRGAPHFHLFTNFRIPKEIVALWWSEIVDPDDQKLASSCSRVEALRSGRWGTTAYATKYAAKAGQKEVPENYTSVGRFWGACGDVSCQSLFFLVPLDLMGGELHKKLKEELRNLLEKTRGQWSRMKFGQADAYISGFRFKTRELAQAVQVVLTRHACMMSSKADVRFETPTMEVLE